MNTAVVARTGWRMARRALWSGGRPRRGLLLLGVTLLMMLAVLSAALLVFEALGRPGVPPAWSSRVLAWAFTLAMAVLTLGDLHVAVATLVAAPDLERLRAAPLTPRQLLALKLWETLPRTLPPVLGIALPVALAYVWVVGGSNLWALAPALFALWAVPLGLACAIALPLLRHAPAAYVRESLAVLATFAFVAGWLANAFWMPHVAGEGAGLAAGMTALPAPPAWSPATWAAHALSTAAPRAWPAAVACVLTACVALALAMLAATRLLAGLHERAAAAAGRTVRASARRAPTLAWAFLKRDAALVTRDWPVALDALASLALWALLPLAVLPLAPLPALELARDMVIALSVSLGNDIAARALPLERTSLAWARLSPVGGARWVRRRALGVGVVSGVLLLAASALVCLALGLRGRAVLDLVTFAFAAAIPATATGLLVGALLGDPNWVDPRAMLGAGGRMAAAAALLVQAGVWLAIAHTLSTTEPLSLGVLGSLLLASAVLAWLLLSFAARVVERWEFSRC